MAQAVLVGTYENICIYRLAGFKTVEVTSPEEAKKAVTGLANEDTAVIFIEEDMATDISDNYKSIVPLIPIPFVKKEKSKALIKLREQMSKATGSDMIFGKD